MAFSQPYPPTAITYLEYNALVDAMETRFGPGAVGYIKDATQIINSRGNLWDFDPGNVQLAIDDIYSDLGGWIRLPKGKVTETSQWLLDEVYPVHIFGQGMCWHGLDYGTQVEFNLANGIHCIEIDASAPSHFGGIYDMTLYPLAGNRDVIYLDSMSDYHIERIYINQAKRHGINVENTDDSWNLWVKDCLIENTTQSGIRLNGGAGAGVILKSYFLNNYFFANNIDFEIGSLDGVVGKVRFCQFHNNQHFNTVAQGMKFYRRCEDIIVNGPIFYDTGDNAIEIDDDGVANKCTRINFVNGNIHGNAGTPIGIDLKGYTDTVIIDDFQIHDIVGANISKGANVSNILEGFNILDGEVLPITHLHGGMHILGAGPVTVIIDVLNAWHLVPDMISDEVHSMSFEAGQDGTIASVANGGGGEITVTTTNPHNLAEGDFVSLTNTTDYDGVYEVESIGGANIFNVTVAWNVNRTGGWAQGSSLSPDETVTIAAHISISATPGANKTFEFGLFKNGVIQPEWTQSRKFAAADEGNITLVGEEGLTKGDILQFGVMNTTDNTDIVINHLNFVVHVL